jgi:hypothetical protein
MFPDMPAEKPDLWQVCLWSETGCPISFFGVAAILLMVALLAVLIPARAVSLGLVAALPSE